MESAFQGGSCERSRFYFAVLSKLLVMVALRIWVKFSPLVLCLLVYAKLNFVVEWGFPALLFSVAWCLAAEGDLLLLKGGGGSFLPVRTHEYGGCVVTVFL